MKYNIDSSRGKIYEQLKKIAPKSWELDSSASLLFKTKKISLQTSQIIIDMTSLSKISKNSSFDYGFPLSNFNKNVSNPGCSANLALHLLYNIRKHIENIQIDSYFPLSAISNNSPNKDKIKIDKIIKINKIHYHKSEIELALGTSINYNTYLTNRPNCIKMNITFESKQDINFINKKILLYNFIYNKTINTDEVKGTNNINYQIKSISSSNHYQIVATIDNLYFSAWYAIEIAKKISDK
jgi:N-acetyl-gamma-glutamylphosphate reductase